MPRPDQSPDAHAILAALAQLVTDREHDAHEALQVGGYLPLDGDFPVEIPLSLCYAAREIVGQHEVSARTGMTGEDTQNRG